MSAQGYEVLETELLSDNWAILKKTKLRLTFSDGTTSDQWRETYDRGDGAAILPFDPERRHVLLGRQFRWPAAYRGDPEPYLIEAAAGLLDENAPADCAQAEAQEELGLSLSDPEFLFALYMSPGSVTEQIHFFLASYRADDAVQKFGGLKDEGEEVEVLDLPLSRALEMVRDGEIRDGKTVILLQQAALRFGMT